WRQLRRWNLEGARLPAGTDVRFRRESAWQRYRKEIVGIGTVMLLLSLSVSALLVQAQRRRRAERSLRESEARMSLAANAANLGFWSWNVARDRIWATEHAWSMLRKAPRNDGTLDHLIEALHPVDRTRFRGAIEGSVATGKPFEMEYRVPLEDGSLRWVGA